MKADETAPGSPSREQEFQDRLLAAVNKVGRHTRHGVAAILDDIKGLGGLQAAKKRLRTRDWCGEVRLRPSEYFLAAERAGRMELSVEAIALEPRWQGLFTPGEIEEAAATLSEHGFAPAPEAPKAPETSALMASKRQPSLAQIRLIGSSKAVLTLDSLSAPTGRCEITAMWAAALREGRCPPAHPVVRKHIRECPGCQGLYPDLIAAFERFDEWALLAWCLMLAIFQETMKLEDEDLKRFGVVLESDDDEDGDEVREPAYIGSDLDSIREVCAWRAVRLGCHIGRFMSAFASTFDEGGDPWLRWRRGETQGPIPTSDCGIDIKTIGRQPFVLGLLARNLLLVRSWPSEDEGVLWVPSDEGLLSVRGLVHLDYTRTVIDEWEEVLGPPPRDLDLLGILYLARQAAVAEAGESEASPNETAAARESREQLGRMEEMLRTIQRLQAEALERQDAIIEQMERMVLHMKSTDLHACEESLLAELPGVYEKLTPEARNLVLAAEQIYRTPGFAAPGHIVHGLATAFELQLQHSVVSGIFDHLTRRYRGDLLWPLPEWTDAEARGKPLWKSGYRADMCLFGAMRLILRHPHPAIGEALSQFGQVREDIQRAVESVYSRRNPAAHGGCFDVGTADAIRADWFHWGKRPGGIFSVFFRNE